MVNKTSSRFKRDGFILNYAIKGDGTPVIVIGSHKYYPRTFSTNLQKYLQMIFVDHRGFAKASSAATKQSFELLTILKDVECLRKKLQLEKIIIMGHSVHALIALEYAKKYPVSALVLIASSPITGSKLYTAADKYFQESVWSERKTALTKNLSTLEAETASNPDKAFITRMLKFGPMIWYDFTYDASKLWDGVTLNPKGATIIWEEMFAHYDIEQDLNNIKCPVFLALGRYDYWNPPHLWERYRSKFNDLTIRIFEKSGHTPQLEEACAFDEELLKWLNEKNKS